MTIAVIPSRYGSSRLAGKPLMKIAGVPMIQRVYEQAQKAVSITRVVVATDDNRIMDAVKAFGGEAVMTSNACRSGTDRVAETADALGVKGHEVIVNVQGDQPIFHPEAIDELIAPFKDDPELKMSTLAYRIQDPREITDPKDVKVTFDVKGFALYFSRAQIPFPRDNQKGVDFFKHLGFYAYTKNFLDTIVSLPSGRCEEVEKLEQLRVLEHGYPIKVVISQHDSPEMDELKDLARIESKLLAGDI